MGLIIISFLFGSSSMVQQIACHKVKGLDNKNIFSIFAVHGKDTTFHALHLHLSHIPQALVPDRHARQGYMQN